MELILLQKVHKLGDLGDRVRVRPGYGRNYLIPKGLAVPATPENIAFFEQKRAEYEQRARDLLALAEARKAAIEGVEVTIAANASTEGKLYGSVGPRDVAHALAELGHSVDKSEIHFEEGGVVRQIGEYKAVIRLHADVRAEIRVRVVAES
ncbi:MAG: 50S ribosomal protein L9 [Lysobacterales bacterium]|jgi:large subunit ribosomal protein L9|nr:MAG: 50S ribosomal protein L9 [Xanthomonadales bacterium]